MVFIFCYHTTSYAYQDADVYANGGTWSWGWKCLLYNDEGDRDDGYYTYMPQAPTRAGYTFLGYTQSSFLQGTEDEAVAKAVYKMRRSGSGTVSFSTYKTTSSSAEYWANPTGTTWHRYDYTFNASTGAYTEKHYSKVKENDDYRLHGTRNGNVKQDLERMLWAGQRQIVHHAYWAVWEKKPGFQINYNSNGGASVASISDAEGAITLSSPTRTGYTFDGWYNGNTRIGGAGDKWTPTSDATLTAKWTPIIYTIRYNTYEGNLSKEKIVTYTVESPTITLENPTLDGKEFLGWSDWNDGSPKKPYTIPKGTIGDLIISANWGVPKNNGSGAGNGETDSGSSTDNSNTSHIFTGQSYVKSNRFKIKS